MNNTIDISQYTAHLYPGRFEGETAATEYFWEQMLNGDGEALYIDIGDDGVNEYLLYDTEATIFHVNAEEAEAFGFLAGEVFMLWQDTCGFVYGSRHANVEEARARFQRYLGLTEVGQ